MECVLTLAAFLSEISNCSQTNIDFNLDTSYLSNIMSKVCDGDCTKAKVRLLDAAAKQTKVERKKKQSYKR